MRARVFLVAVVVLLYPTTPVYSEADEQRHSLETLSDRTELEGFVDAFFAAEMNRRHIPGLVITIVKDGEPLLTKGFGWADLEEMAPVVPEKTVFRVGSVSKLITATALMQLAERGGIDLNADVGLYLNPIEMDDSFRQPITAAHLLTHTAGLDDRYIGIAARNRSEGISLRRYLASRLPPRVRAPGKLIAYSNHGFALAGLLVEEISGMPFDSYIERHIFQPLAMERTSFGLPPRLEADLAVGYRYLKDAFVPAAYDHFNLAPASSLNSTAPDMARFMTAVLEEGSYRGSRILSSQSIEEMLRRRFTHHPLLAGRTYGFHERFENGERAIAHAGGVRGYSSYLLLVPARRLGFFIAYNRFDEEKLYEEFRKRFFDRYFPAPEDPRHRVPLASVDRFTGSYRSLRYLSKRSFEKLMTLFSEYRVTLEQGTLTVRYPDDFRQPSRWEEVGPLLFRGIGEDGHLAFQENERGEVTHMFIGAEAYERLDWYEEPGFHKGLFGFFTPAFLTAGIVGALFFLVAWAGSRRPANRRLVRLAYLLAISVSALNVSFLVGLGHFGAHTDAYSYLYGMPPVMTALLFIPLVTVGLTLALTVLTGLAWKRRYGSLPGRVYFSLTALVALAFIPFLHYWNLLGFRY
jgi:CubicO group peptidase (beta-lactamase class C family)